MYAYIAGLPAELHSSWAASWYANNVFQLTSLLDQLRQSASWLSEDTRLEFWRKCYTLLVEHDVTPTTAANFLQVSWNSLSYFSIFI